MKNSIVAVACSLAGSALIAGVALAGGDATPERDRAAAAVKAFAGELKQALTGTMSSAGPVAAIDVCKTEAPAIAARLSDRSGLRLSRTGTRVRNPGNAPNDWQSEVLQAWQRQQADGADLKMVEYFEVLADGGFRYMKPIVVQPLCLTCHGAALASDVDAALASTYPRDRATGYAAGDLRGAFVVEN